MNARLIVVIAVAAVSAGCAAVAPFDPAGSCVTVIGDVYVQDLRDCGCINQVVKGVTAQLPDMDYSKVRVWVYASDNQLEAFPGHRQPWGRTLPGSGGYIDIYLERYMRSLGHELEHAKEMEDGISPDMTSTHPDWNTNGKMALGNKLWFVAERLSCK
jgi:hypothetical protein